MVELRNGVFRGLAFIHTRTNVNPMSKVDNNQPPIIVKFGSSERAKHYGIDKVKEAKLFISHPTLSGTSC